MVPCFERRHVVRSWAGWGTTETIYEDNCGRTYREITEAETQTIRNTTAGQVYYLDNQGNIRP